MNIVNPRKGDIVLLKRNKTHKSKAAFTMVGKVILFKNPDKLHLGFVEIESSEDKGKYFIAKGHNVHYDYYHGIKLSELEKTLETLGFVKEYECKIDEQDKFIIYAHLEYGALLSIETWSKDGKEGYNTIYLTIPTDQHIWSHCGSGIYIDGGRTATFNLLNCKYEAPIKNILSIRRLSTDWEQNGPHLWHYGDDLGRYGDETLKAIQEISQRVFEFKDDLNTLFNFGIKKL